MWKGGERGMTFDGMERTVPDVSDQPLDRLMSLDGRTAVVTGGARNIGLAIACRLAEAGARVVIADTDGPEGELGAEYVRTRGGTAMSIAVNMRDGDTVRALADTVADRFGAIDIWVNNAGMFPTRGFLEMSDADWDAMIELNLRGTFLGCREAARRMVAAGRGGVIVNIASAAAFRASGTELSHYVASKFGVRGLTQALAVELGRHGIRVIGVAPTYVERRQRKSLHIASPTAGQEPRAPHLMFHLPLGREGVPDDVARVVLFCASDLAILLTGSTIPVDAGQLAV
jgi:NAD(P)-dependent dehydrogenase (short-subunit alcohol dehydrogenase family)